MNTYDSTYRGGTLAAVFPDRHSASEALRDLHDAGFRNAWLGVTRGDSSSTGGATIESTTSGGSVMDSIGRFFSGEGTQEQALHHALIGRDLSEDQARRIESSIVPGSAVVTVDAENDSTEAVEILERRGGTVEGRSSGASGIAAGAATARGTTPKSSGIDGDDARRLELREERLSIDKQRVSAGEARVRKEVVSEQQSIDVPVFHEELFIERRPVSGAAATAATTPIGDGEEIRIPLSKERVDVQKRTVVTEEVAVGKRQVQGTEHVSDTVRREELEVDDVTQTRAKGTLDPDLRDR